MEELPEIGLEVSKRVEWSFRYTKAILIVPCKAGNIGRVLGCIRRQAICTHRVLSDI
jgi:hypothetical protein